MASVKDQRSPFAYEAAQGNPDGFCRFGSKGMVMNTQQHIIERYRRVREYLRQARARGGEDEVDRLQDESDGLWRVMSEAARRSVLGVGEQRCTVRSCSRGAVDSAASS